MARKNRKQGREGNRIVFWGVPLMALAAATALVYVQLFYACENVGREIKRLEHEHAELRKRVVNEEHNWGTASSIRNMEALMARHGIVMTWPDPRDVIRLVARDKDEPAQYAQGTGAIWRD